MRVVVEAEAVAVAYCFRPYNDTRPMPDGFIQTAHFVSAFPWRGGGELMGSEDDTGLCADYGDVRLDEGALFRVVCSCYAERESR